MRVRHVRRLLRPLAVLCIAALVAPTSVSSSRVGTLPMEPVIRGADSIVIATVREVKTFQNKKGRHVCWEDVTMTLVSGRVLSGTLAPGTPLAFSYRILMYDTGPCPRLYFANPPHARVRVAGERIESEVVASVVIRRSQRGVAYEVTGTYPLEKLDVIKRLRNASIRKKVD